MKRTSNRFFKVFILLLYSLAFFSSQYIKGPPSLAETTEGKSYACGSYSMIKDDNSETGYNNGSRPYLEYYTDKGSTTSNIERKTLINVYMYKGETLYLASSVDDSILDENNQRQSQPTGKDIILIKPDGNIESFDVTTEQGYISTPEKEKNGPNIYGITDGYDALSYTAESTGIYQVHFHSQTGNGDSINPTPKHVNDQWEQKTGTVAAWNASVVTQDGILKPGRIFTKCIAMNMGQNDQSLNSKLYVVTTDGYIYKLDFNGMDPFGFIFFADNRGLISTDSNQSLYCSYQSDEPDLNDMESKYHVTFQNPWNKDTETDKTFNIFFETPDSELEGNLYPIVYQSEPIKNLTFIGSHGDNQTHVGFGGYFQFEATVPTQADITLDFTHVKLADGTVNDYGKVNLSTSATVGTNTIYWNGCGENGIPIPPGVYDATSINVSMQTHSGEFHFPLLDVENCPNGIKLTRINKIYRKSVDNDGNIYNEDITQNYEEGKSTVYYDNSTTGEADFEDHKIDGVNTDITPAIKFNEKAGDRTELDIWTYANNAKEITTTLDTSVIIKDDQYTVLTGNIFYDKLFTENATDNIFRLSEGDFKLSGVKVKLEYSYKDATGTLNNKVLETTTDSTGTYRFAGIPIMENGEKTTCKVSITRPHPSYHVTTQNTYTGAPSAKGEEIQTLVLGGFDNDNNIIYSPSYTLADVGYHYDIFENTILIKKDWVTSISSDNNRPESVTITVHAYYLDNDKQIETEKYTYTLNDANHWEISLTNLPKYADEANTKPLLYEIFSESYSLKNQTNVYTVTRDKQQSSEFPYETLFLSKKEDAINTLVLTAQNSPKMGTCEIIKRDSVNTSELLSGVEFTLWQRTNLTQIPQDQQEKYLESSNYIWQKKQVATTNQNGIIVFKDLEYNYYLINETGTKQGYQPNKEIYIFNISDTDRHLTKTVYNTKLKANVTVVKNIDFVKPDTNVPITISYADNQFFNHAVSQTKTIAITHDMHYSVLTMEVPSQNYVKVSEQTKDYKLNSQTSTIYDSTADKIISSSYTNGQIFKVTEGHSYIVTLNNMMMPDISYTMKIRKIDGKTEADIANAQFTLYSDKECTNILSTSSTVLDKEGKAFATFKELTPGTYYLKETFSPSGYQLPTDTKTIIITDEGIVTVNNTTINVVSDTFTITVANYFGVVLPQSGSPISSLTISVIGMGVCACAIILMIWRKRNDLKYTNKK